MNPIVEELKKVKVFYVATVGNLTEDAIKEIHTGTVRRVTEGRDAVCKSLPPDSVSRRLDFLFV